MKSLLRVLSLSAIIFSCTQSNQKSDLYNLSNGSVERIENFDSRFITPRNVDIWLPDDYSINNKYAVIYMHDGQMLFDSTKTWNGQEWGVDEALGSLIMEEKVRDAMIIGIWNTTDRHSEYFPQKVFESLNQKIQDSLYSLNKYQENPIFTQKIQSDNYLKFIVEELKPYIDQNYSTLADAENTLIMGSSMGGLISLYGICEYPEVFGGAACLSTHWPGVFSTESNPIPDAFFNHLISNLPEPTSHKLYFDLGTETLDKMYVNFQPIADSIIISKGYSTHNFVTKKFIGDGHDEKSWRKRLHIPLTFLLEKK